MSQHTPTAIWQGLGACWGDGNWNEKKHIYVIHRRNCNLRVRHGRIVRANPSIGAETVWRLWRGILGEQRPDQLQTSGIVRKEPMICIDLLCVLVRLATRKCDSERVMSHERPDHLWFAGPDWLQICPFLCTFGSLLKAWIVKKTHSLQVPKVQGLFSKHTGALACALQPKFVAVFQLTEQKSSWLFCSTCSL